MKPLSNLVVFLVAMLGVNGVRGASDHLTIETNTGIYIGIINGSTPNVRQFLGIPYALPPLRERRWLPPVPLDSNRSDIVDATVMPLSCSQNVARVPTVYNQNLTRFIIPQLANDSFAVPSTEDCLTLAIWTPLRNATNLPVAMFFTGGGFDGGGVNIGHQLPQNWVERTRSHIVVTINYRLNIMGFPGAAGLYDQNLGILDQRMAVEWVQANIAAFGGDPTKITLMGQSAGSASVDIHNFAFYENPIVSGYFMMSGVAGLGTTSSDHSNFTFVASHLGCGGLSPKAELDCMREVPIEALEDFWSQYADNGTAPSLSWGPFPDERIVFSNYTERYAIGAISRVPAILSNVAFEGSSLAGPYNVTAGPDRSVAISFTESFACLSHNASELRAAVGLLTYRHEYAGNFTNISLLPWLGAFHGSDLPMVFGTYDDFNGPAEPFEVAVSQRMQDLLMAFMIDPECGPKNMGYPPFETGQMLRFGADGRVSQILPVSTVYGVCTGNGAYNPTP